MKITLNNFKCWKKKEVDFGDNGMTLINGTSGVGKTSLIQAIYFVLFGVGSKLNTIGSSGKLSVTLEIDDMKITRTKRPNILTLDQGKNHWEDEVAQNIINKKFGNHFNTSCYLSQGGNNSFILMSPLEKLSFLEKIAFEDIDIDGIKKRMSEKIKKSKEDLISKQSSLEVAESLLSDVEKPTKPLFSKPKNVKDVSVLEEELNETLLWKRETKILKEQLETYCEKFDELNDKYEELELDWIGIDELKEMKTKIKNTDNNRKKQSIKTQINNSNKTLKDMIKSEKKNLQDRLKEIDNQMSGGDNYNELNSRLDEIEEMANEEKERQHVMKKMKNIKDKMKPLDKLNDKKKKVEDNIKKAQGEKKFCCPHCKKFVNVSPDGENLNKWDENAPKIDIDTLEEWEDKLESYNTMIDKQKSLSQNLEELDEYLKKYKEHNLDELKSELEELREKKSMISVLTREKEKIEKKLTREIKTDAIVNLRNTIDELNEELEEIGDEDDLDVLNEKEYEEMKDTYQSQLSVKQEMKSYKRQLDELKENKKQVETKIKDKKSKHKERWEKLQSPKKLKDKIAKLKEKIQLKEEWDLYESNYENWKNKKDKCDEYKKKMIECEKIHTASLNLKEYILETESKMLEETTKNINIHANTYLEEFFQDEPIQVIVELYKENKKQKEKKPKINLKIIYKEKEIEFSSLSGGEMARVILAYTMALADMFNSRLIMLDESTASLDEHNTSLVFESIRDRLNNSLCIVIAHQVVSGEFDNKILL